MLYEFFISVTENAGNVYGVVFIFVHVYMKLSELHCDSKSQGPEFTDFENVCNGHISQ